MFERLKSLFTNSNQPPEIPESVWALTVLLNPDAKRKLTPDETVAYALRNADDLGERTHTLYYDGLESRQKVALYSSQDDACLYVKFLSERRERSDAESDVTTFGMVLLRRELLYERLRSAPNLRIVLDAGLPEERQLDLDELRRYVKD